MYYDYQYFNDNFLQFFDILLFILDCVSEGIQNIWKNMRRVLTQKLILKWMLSAIFIDNVQNSECFGCSDSENGWI